jgi:hypothetical protein
MAHRRAERAADRGQRRQVEIDGDCGIGGQCAEQQQLVAPRMRGAVVGGKDGLGFDFAKTSG